MRSTQPDFPVSGEMLLDKAKQFASLSGTVSDKSVMLGPSWISHWKSHHGISSKKLVGEASSVDTLVVDEWLNTKLPLLMTEFPLVNIYNVDETGPVPSHMPLMTIAPIVVIPSSLHLTILGQAASFLILLQC